MGGKAGPSSYLEHVRTRRLVCTYCRANFRGDEHENCRNCGAPKTTAREVKP